MLHSVIMEYALHAKKILTAANRVLKIFVMVVYVLNVLKMKIAPIPIMQFV